MKWFAIVAYIVGIGFIVAFIVVVWMIAHSLPG